MKYSEKRIKNIIEQGLDHYTSEDYEEYEYGDPAEAARAIKEKIDRLIGELKKDLDTAGGFLRPGLKKATLNYIKKKFKNEV